MLAAICQSHIHLLDLRREKVVKQLSQVANIRQEIVSCKAGSSPEVMLGLGFITKEVHVWQRVLKCTNRCLISQGD